MSYVILKLLIPSWKLTRHYYCVLDHSKAHNKISLHSPFRIFYMYQSVTVPLLGIVPLFDQ